MKQREIQNTLLKIGKWLVSIISIVFGCFVSSEYSLIGGLSFIGLGVCINPLLFVLLRKLLPYIGDKIINVHAFEWRGESFDKLVKRILSVFVSVLLVIGLIFTIITVSSKPVDSPQTADQVKKVEDSALSTNTPKPNYQILKEAYTRYDGAKSCFILINNVDLSNDAFIDTVKAVIDYVTSKAGGKITIEIFDKKSTLEVYVKSSYVLNKLGRTLTQSEQKELEQHQVATFAGELSTMPDNLLMFPSATTDSKIVGQYVNASAYQPKQ